MTVIVDVNVNSCSIILDNSTGAVWQQNHHLDSEWAQIGQEGEQTSTHGVVFARTFIDIMYPQTPYPNFDHYKTNPNLKPLINSYFKAKPKCLFVCSKRCPHFNPVLTTISVQVRTLVHTHKHTQRMQIQILTFKSGCYFRTHKQSPHSECFYTLHLYLPTNRCCYFLPN